MDSRKGKTTRSDRDLGTSRGRQRGGERTRDTEFTGTHRGTPGAGRCLGIRSRTARELSTGTSGGGRHVGETSRWTDAPRPGKLIGRSGCNRDSETA